MSRVFLNNNAINQKGTPLLYTDILSNRPQYGINGRLFFSTDSQQIFEDTGTSWLLLADATGSVTGYVPYVGATTNLNLGLFNITASSLITSGGTSSQFVKGNGTLDSTTYVSLTAISGTSPIQYNNTTGVISILQSNTSQSGYLSSTDWNTFNNKAGLASFSATTPLSYNSGTGAFSIQVANTGQSGYLTNTDWNTFNNKQPQINGTGFVKATGTTISYDNSTYLTTTTAGTTYVPYSGSTGAVNLGTNTLTAQGIVISYPSSDAQLSTTNTNGTSYFGTQYSAYGALSAGDTKIYAGGGSAIVIMADNLGGIIKFATGGNATKAIINASGSLTLGSTSGTGTGALYSGAITSSGLITGVTGLFGGASSFINAQTKVQIGTSGADNRIAIVSSAAYAIELLTTGNAAILGTNSSGDFLFGNNAGITVATISQTGGATFSSSVGIGTSSPSYKLSVQGPTLGTAISWTDAFNNTGYLSIRAAAAAIGADNNLVFETATTERMRITSGGNLLVGSTTDNGKKLQVNGTTTTTAFAASGATYTVSATVSEQYYHVFTGAVGQTLTLLSPSSNNLQYVIINNSANTLTVAAAASTNIINTVGSSVSTITLIANQRVFLIADGNNKYYQIF